MGYSSPMIAKVPEKLRNQIKNLSVSSSAPYGSLRSIFDTALSEFLEAKPWKKEPYFTWSIPAKNMETQKNKWVLFNVVAEDSICNKVKNEAWKLEISLQTFLYSALSWWYFSKAVRDSADEGQELIEKKNTLDIKGDLFADEAKDLLKKGRAKKEESAL